MIRDTCAYCTHHWWSDEPMHHVCMVDPENPTQMSCTGECRRFRDAGRFHMGEESE